jgi:hypothetical protein
VTERPTCRYDRTIGAHLTREHTPECVAVGCQGCRPCTHDEGNPVRHCRVRLRCTSHLGWTEHACPVCLGKIRANLTQITALLALMPAEAVEQGVNSEAANLAGPHADYVTAQWRLINADRAGESVDELDLRDPFTCLTMHERTIREELGHDDTTLVSPTVTASAGYLSWVLTDLARAEDHADTLGSLLGDTARLVMHLEGARKDHRTPQRGAPCPECVGTGNAPQRLVRHHGHWCTADGCTRLHYLDDSGDTWRCPSNPAHEWSHEDYTRWIEEGKLGA